MIIWGTHFLLPLSHPLVTLHVACFSTCLTFQGVRLCISYSEYPVLWVPFHVGHSFLFIFLITLLTTSLCFPSFKCFLISSLKCRHFTKLSSQPLSLLSPGSLPWQPPPSYPLRSHLHLGLSLSTYPVWWPHCTTVHCTFLTCVSSPTNICTKLIPCIKHI